MKVVDSRLERIMTAAAAAPSVHNTQPSRPPSWRTRRRAGAGR